MGSKHSKHTKSSEDPYRALADQAASRLNAQNPNGMGAQQIAAAVANGKEPLIVMLRRNEQGKFAYDQEHYDKWKKDLKKLHRHKRGERSRAAGIQVEAGQQDVPAVLQGNQGPDSVYTQGDGIQEKSQQHALGDATAGSEGRGRDHGKSVKIDRERRAFVYRRN